LQRWGWATDIAIALLVLLMLLQPLVSNADCDCDPGVWWAYALVVVQAVPLVWRRRWPLAVVLVSGGAAAVYGMTEQPDPAVPFAALVAVYSVAAHDTRRRANLAGVVGLVLVALVLVTDPGVDLADVTVNYLVFVTAWLLGDTARRRRDRATELEERAAYLERTRAAEAEAAAAGERNRIARELHDVVAHHPSLMVVQAEAGPVVVRTDPDRAVEVFEAISTTGREALSEMRRLLGVLKRPDAAPGPGEGSAEPPLTPQPDATHIPALVERVRETGFDVDLSIEGHVEALPPAVGLTAYRIVQEALTNAVRHGRPDNIRVQVSREPQSLVLVVEDNGPSARAAVSPGGGSVAKTSGGLPEPPDTPQATAALGQLSLGQPSLGEASLGQASLEQASLGQGGALPMGEPGAAPSAGVGGHGLVAMRERVLLVGGTVTAGPLAGGGWRVHARLPVDDRGSA
jgi:signal transduction histidine kinase